MFTGLIQTIGRISKCAAHTSGKSFRIACHLGGEDLCIGESIAVDGICITVEAFDRDGFDFSASRETLQRSTLSRLSTGNAVHLERALKLGDRLGGHWVQGHVDGMGKVKHFDPQGEHAELTIVIPQELRRYVAEKGSIAIQGVSLTVARLKAGFATMALIAETIRRTNLGRLKSGDLVNLEVDILAKYVESLLGHREDGLSNEKLDQWGFTE